MTLYIVKHGEMDYRLNREDGEQITTWAADPREMDNTEALMADAIADHYPGASLLGNPDARQDYTDAVTSNYNFRDVQEHGMSEVPW